MARGSSSLARWEAEGTDTFQLADLAAELLGNAVSAVPGGRRITVRNAADDLADIEPRPYLQLALICRAPEDRPYDVAGFEIMRLWLLLEALERAELGNRRDRNMETAADGLRKAGEDREGKNWLPVIRRLEPPSHSLAAIRLYLMRECSAQLADKETVRSGTAHAKFFQAVLEVARGASAQIADGHTAPDSWLPVEEQQSAMNRPDRSSTARGPDHLAEDEVQSGGNMPIDSDEDGEDGLPIDDVDPTESYGEQAAEKRYVTLTVAARARLTRWNWDVINPNEEAALAERIVAAYRGNDDQQRRIAAITDLCLTAGRSLGIALRLVVDGESLSTMDWMVDLRAGTLRRKAPRRARHSKAMPRMAMHLAPESEYVALSLAPDCVQVLRRMKAARGNLTGALRLSDLWPDSEATPAEAFRDWLRSDATLWRLTPGMLSSVAERNLYESNKGDWLQARLLVSPADAGLPAAAAYSAYADSEIVAGLAQWWSVGSQGNAAGSLIDAADNFYRNGLSRMRADVDESSNGPDFVEHHNRASLYWDAALRAGTGVRPGTDLWSWKNFDFKQRFAFIDDKTGIDESAARWVVVPDTLLAALQTEYLGKHVPSTIHHLLKEFGEGASQACSQVQSSLVWLRREGTTVVAEPLGPRHRQLRREQSAEFPLVVNAFRHRARTVWRRLGCHQEVIDSLLGHTDGATRTHGDYSPRAWAEDARQAYSAISGAFDSLEFVPPAGWFGALHSAGEGYETPWRALPIPTIGPKSTARWKTLLHAARQTLTELSLQACRHAPNLLRELARGRLPLRRLLMEMPSWTEAEAATAVKALTTTQAGTPATLGSMKLLVLGRLADRAWEETGKRIPVRRRSFSMMSRDEPRATPSAVGARERYECWRLLLERIRESSPIEKLSPADAGALLVVELVIGSRITDRELLADACRGACRIVRWNASDYFEWVPNALPPAMGHGVVRHRVTARAAALVGVLHEASKLHHSTLSNASSLLRPLIAATQLVAPVSISALSEKLCETIDGLNCIELPGNVAAARAGRIRTAALSWPDWTRSDDGSFFAPESTAADIDDDQSVASALPGAAIAFTPEPKATSRENARLFSKAIRKVLDSTRQGGVDIRPDLSQRRDMARAIARICTQRGEGVSPALLYLGRWCEGLFDRKVTTELLRISSIRRYFGALSHRFEQLAHDVDLGALDEEELTDLYQDILEMHGRHPSTYVLARLREFHKFCAPSFGLAAPDWSELVAEDTGLGVSPGFIDEASYLRAFDKARLQMNPQAARASSLMMLLGYRFGLRKGEVGGLRVKDLVGQSAISIHVVVERLKKRELKSKRGRRVVPQLFELSSQERGFLDDVLIQSRERAKTNSDALLLADPAAPDKVFNADRAAEIVNRILKSATGNTALTGHHLRHSFACLVWKALELQLDDSNDQKLRHTVEHIRNVLLREQRIGRRAPWALASVLGHTHPARAYKSYVHFLCERADQLTFADTLIEDGQGGAGTVNLDILPRQFPVTENSLSPPTTWVPNMNVVVLGVRMLSNGHPPTAVASSLRVDQAWLETTQKTLSTISRRLKIDQPHQSGNRYAKLADTGLLAHVLRSDSLRLTEILVGAESKWIQSTQGMRIPNLDEFCGMIGYRRQFSLWLNSQMIFMRQLLEGLNVERGRLNFIQPKDLADSVKKVAEEIGWIPTESQPIKVDATRHSDIFPLTPSIGERQEPTRFGDPEVLQLHRFSMELKLREGKGIGNRWEMVFAAICFWIWLEARQVSNQAHTTS